ncbi:MAG: DNA translocase FtsK [Candidatus Pacebacteria bacterium]|nr:DNA translocase FtsK [Candidatus Paceibacterota bacterium]
MGRRKKRSLPKLKLRQETIYSIVAVLLIALGILVMFSFTGQGQALLVLNSFLIEKVGLGTLFLPFVFISSGLIMFQTKWAWSKPHILLGTLFLMGGVVGVTKSGSVGIQTFANLSSLISPAGTYVVFSAFIISGALIVSQFSIGEVLEMISGWLAPKNNVKDGKQQDMEEEIEKAKGFRIPKLSFPMSGKKDDDFKVNENKYDEEVVVEKGGTAVVNHKEPQSVDTDDFNSAKSSTNAGPMIWEFPPLSLLSPQGGGEADRGDVKKNADIIEHTLESFGIKAKVKEVNYGPSVTQYALDITRGTKLSRITGLSTDLALALAAPTGQVRIEAPIAGRNLVGIEVPNQSAQYVTLRKMLASPKMKSHKSKLAVALGIDVAGQPVVADIAKMPHVLIAGATGSGKSVCVNTFLCSILFRASPSEVKFILVDPKRVELTAYNNIPHLMTPVIVDPKKVISALKWAVNEMDNRYKKLAEVGVKNIESYNDLAGFVAMSSIVIVIDELADIMLFSPKEVEDSITRIAQMARAVGIHLVLATQRPSVDVITGLIKANVPTRIAFNVSSMMDSRVILDTPGAEKMLGKGDMLYVPPDQAKPSRVQGTYVSDQEIKGLVDFIKSQGEAPEYSQEITEKFEANTISGGSSGTDGEDRDSKFDEAVQLVSQHDKASSSMIQRRLSVGYARAARILDQLFEAGMVSEADGSKPREVNMTVIRDYLAGETSRQ